MAETINYSGFVDRLKSRKDQLPPKLQAVAHYILNNPDDIAILSISKIAMAAGVQPSAVTRFTRELELTGFSELQSVFRERMIGPRLSYAERLKGISEKAVDANSPLDITDPHSVLEAFAGSAYISLMQVVDQQKQAPLNDVVKALRDAPAVHVSGGRGAFSVATYCYYGLASIGKRVFLIDNVGAMREEQLYAMHEDDVLLMISFDDYTRDTIELAEKAFKKKRAVLSITDNEFSPLVPFSKHSLFVREAKLGHFRGLVPAMVLCQSIIVSIGRCGEGPARQN
ncbi:MAG: MurR/RpiR family transcriptional regulator [Rhizobiaceae bacterium]|nr:MurR/RpiR family transcriptional regulator [Rhizobiaceae bacterium]